MTISWFMYIPILVFLGLIVFAIYFAVTLLKLARKKNEYLKEIYEETKKNNKNN